MVTRADSSGSGLDTGHDLGWNHTMASSHSHGSLPQTEPVTPLWLTFAGVGLFVALGAWYMYRTSSDTEVATDELATASPSASTSAKPAGMPSVAPNGQPILRGDDIVKMLNAPAGQHP
jgi:hypothetical protein